MDKEEKIRYLQEITNLSDPTQCHQILDAHEWDLDASVATMLEVNSGEREFLDDGAGPSDVGGATLRSRNGASTSGTRHRHDNAGTSSAPPTQAAAAGLAAVDRRGVSLGRNSLVWRIISLPLSMTKLSFTILSRAIRLVMWAAGGAFSVSLRTVGSAAAWASGAPPPSAARLAGQRLPDPTRFLHSFEAAYGTAHPAFLESSFMESVRLAGAQYKFLFVYLHSAEHTNTPGFCQDTLCSPPVIQFLTENFLVWGGDVRSSEGFQMSKSLRASTYPYCAVVTGSSSQRVSLLQQVEGCVSPASLIDVLQKVMDRQGAMLVAARADEEERTLNRRLREEQDAAYQAALLADQERERRVKEAGEKEAQEAREVEQARLEEEEREAAVAQQAAALEALVLKRQRDKANSLPPEPEKGADVTQVLIRLPEGERKERRFSSSDVVQTVYDYVDSLGILKVTEYKLVSNYPYTLYGRDSLQKTLCEAGMHPHASIFVKVEEE